MRDVGTDVERLKAVLAVEISGTLARERLTVRQAHRRTGIAAADFSRIRNGDLGRFSIDRLMSIVNRLGTRIEFDLRLAQIEVANEPLVSHLDPVSREVANVLVGHLANGHIHPENGHVDTEATEAR